MFQGTHAWSAMSQVLGEDESIWDSRVDQNKYRYVGNSPNRVIDPTGYGSGWVLKVLCCAVNGLLPCCWATPPEVPKGSTVPCEGCKAICNMFETILLPEQELPAQVAQDIAADYGCGGWCGNLTNTGKFDSCKSACYNLGLRSGTPELTCTNCCNKLCPTDAEKRNCLTGLAGASVTNCEKLD